ncbi:MAG: acyl carrier protein [Acidobacteriota bacterium]
MLPETVMTFLNDAARAARASMPGRDESLFQSGLIDSFSLVDFVTLIESECGIRVDDADLRPENFDTIAKVEAFIIRAKAAA